MPTSWLKSTRNRILLSIGILILIGVGGLVIRNQPSFRAYPKRFATVREGVLYRSAQPTARQLANIRNDHGLRTILIVREGDSPRVQDEYDFAKEQGLNIVHIPIESRCPISDEQVRQFFRCLDDPANHPVLIHCSAGRHRTGYLSALYRIERENWSCDKALAEMLSFGFDEDRQSEVANQLRNYQPGRFSAAQARPQVAGEEKALTEKHPTP